MPALKIFIFFTILMMPNAEISAQSSVRTGQLEKRYGGIWIDKKTSRCLQISFENDSYATITDWTRRYQKRESGDVYKAFVKKGKLVMPEDEEHHAPYSEITVEKNILTYYTKLIGPRNTSTSDRQLFTRE